MLDGQEVHISPSLHHLDYAGRPQPVITRPISVKTQKSENGLNELRMPTRVLVQTNIIIVQCLGRSDKLLFLLIVAVFYCVIASFFHRMFTRGSKLLNILGIQAPQPSSRSEY